MPRLPSRGEPVGRSALAFLTLETHRGTACKTHGKVLHGERSCRDSPGNGPCRFQHASRAYPGIGLRSMCEALRLDSWRLPNPLRVSRLSVRYEEGLKRTLPRC